MSILIDNTPDNVSFYFVGESHNFLANNDLLFSMIQELHKKGVYNIINELPHATCFLFNEFLQSGDTLLLTQIQPKATYNILRKIRDLNSTQPLERRIQFYGIDYAAQSDARNLSLVLQLIHARHNFEKMQSLEKAINHYIEFGEQNDSYTQSALEVFNQTVAELLNGSDSMLYKSVLAEDYKDLKMITQNRVGIKGRNDKGIFNAFVYLYDLFFKHNNDNPNPKFLAFYGSGHIRNFAGRLKRAHRSPVKGRVSITNLGYLSCWGGWHHDGVALLQNTGLSNIFSAKMQQLIQGRFSAGNQQEIGLYLNSGKCLKLRKHARLIDAVIIFKHYGDRRMNSWKFD